ncbi:hypothetical protein HK101_002075 [Irineochytrium annulatum]|nr:hypothetical protein HK101_002075 [Irineochytrium annulatum]
MLRRCLFSTAIRSTLRDVGGLGLGRKETDKRLRAREATFLLPKSPTVLRIDTNTVASNYPCEDRHTQASHEGSVIAAVLDGHNGQDCAQALSELLPAYVANSISIIPPAPSADRPRQVARALRSAFERLDADIINGGIDAAALNIIPSDRKPGTQTRTPEGVIRAKLAPALAGSCALVAYVEEEDMYLACVGDCRAVLGRKVAGEVRAMELTVDQTVRNPREALRLLEEHPSEADTVVANGRVLGCVEPTRAFGDSTFKWRQSLHERLLREQPPPNYRTPPYLTADPVVTHHPLDRRDLFVVLATDGLYSELSSAEVVCSVSGFMVARGILAPESLRRYDDRFIHDDDNAATDLIRNALGFVRSRTGLGSASYSEERLDKMLSIPHPIARRFRDDVTVGVMFFAHPGQEAVDVDKLLKPLRSPVTVGVGEVDLARAGIKRHRLEQWVNSLQQTKIPKDDPRVSKQMI